MPRVLWAQGKGYLPKTRWEEWEETKGERRDRTTYASGACVLFFTCLVVSSASLMCTQTGASIFIYIYLNLCVYTHLYLIDRSINVEA